MKKNHFKFFFYAGLALTLWSCKAKVGVEVERGPEAASLAPPESPPQPQTPSPGAGKPNPVDVTGSLSVNKEFFQTKTVVRLEYQNELFREGAKWGLVNTTTQKNLLEGQMLTLTNGSEEGLSDNISQEGPWILNVLELEDSYMLLNYGVASQKRIDLYPWVLTPFPPLVYGENEILFTSTFGESVKQEKRKITLRDFTVFEMSTATFGSSLATEMGLQGQVSFLSESGPLSNGTRILTSGYIPMISH